MKKSIIALMGLFTLLACSDESYQETDKMNDTGTVENTGPQNSIKTVDPSIPYTSPYDVSNGPCCNLVEYIIRNNTDLDFMYMQFVGLAKYDGVEDNRHFGWPLTPASNYPNLIKFESGEYLDIIPTKEQIIGAHTTISSGAFAQLPISGTGNFFEIEPSLNPTGLESSLLHEFGKVYCFIVDPIDPITNLRWGSNASIKVPFLPSGITNPNQLSSDWVQLPPSPSLFDDDFWYNINSREICSGSDPSVDTAQLQINKMESVRIMHNAVTGKYYKIESLINATQVILTIDEV